MTGWHLQGAVYATNNGAYTWSAAVQETVDATLNRTVSSGACLAQERSHQCSAGHGKPPCWSQSMVSMMSMRGKG